MLMKLLRNQLILGSFWSGGWRDWGFKGVSFSNEERFLNILKDL
jgi:hypothetical protein